MDREYNKLMENRVRTHKQLRQKTRLESDIREVSKNIHKIKTEIRKLKVEWPDRFDGYF